MNARPIIVNGVPFARQPEKLSKADIIRLTETYSPYVEAGAMLMLAVAQEEFKLGKKRLEKLNQRFLELSMEKVHAYGPDYIYQMKKHWREYNGFEWKFE